jgi:DNA-binding PadR family transcriptional regulator
VNRPSLKEFELLALLGDGRERAGREVAKLYEKENGGRTISYGTLYTTFRRLHKAGWVAVRDDQDRDGRVRYFRLLGAGMMALDEARRHHARLAVFGLRRAGS